MITLFIAYSHRGGFGHAIVTVEHAPRNGSEVRQLNEYVADPENGGPGTGVVIINWQVIATVDDTISQLLGPESKP